MSALVSACRRLSASGKRNKPTVPARKKQPGADRDNAEEVNDKNSSAIRDVWSLRRRGAVDEGGGSEGREQRKPKRNIFDPLRARGPGDEKQCTDSPGADELRRHQAIGVARAARMRTSPTATVKRMTPAVARRNSVTADRPDEQPLFRRQIGRDGLADVEAMNEKRAMFVGPGRQSSRHQTGKGAESASLAAGRQTHWAGDQSWMQSQPRIEGPPRHIRSRNHRLA